MSHFKGVSSSEKPTAVLYDYEKNRGNEIERNPVIQLSNNILKTELILPSPDEIGIFFFNTKVILEASEVGGKAANMQKLSHVAEISIPIWLVLSRHLFHQFLKENDLFTLINQLDILCQNSKENTLSIKLLASQIQSLINQKPLSKNLFLKIKEAYEKLCLSTLKSPSSFAVRSSGIIEDSAVSSCAGLYDTHLNIHGLDHIIKEIKSVWASSFNLRVVQERIRLSLKQTQCEMGVIIQELVDSRASGVVSTIVLSNNYPGIQVSGNYGVGESVVSGEVSVDGWVLHPTKDYILETIKGSKDSCHLINGSEGIEKISLLHEKKDAFVMSRKELSELTTQVKKIKSYYNQGVLTKNF